ncbi:methyl-accepting chemotaxis protein [Micromonospora orduensis]|uniref:methyl-accepting chemotaxis protein n=1 Tax=Micromonospora orduensis TaxID=1420891 RepID=UPI0033EE8F5F
MESLASNIANINQIIASIQSITEQTNLLALNAPACGARPADCGRCGAGHRRACRAGRRR